MRTRETILNLVALTGAMVACASSGRAAGQCESARLVPDDAATGRLFGYAIAMDGSRVVVGARGDDQAGSFAGSAYVFRRHGDGWTQEAKLTAFDAATGKEFGYAVAISGDQIAIGAPGDDQAGTLSGAVYIYTLRRGTWQPQGKIMPRDASAGDMFGQSVAISGDMLAAGARGGDRLRRFAGSAYVFRRVGDAWIQEAELTANDASADDWFGISVSISGDRVAVGAHLGGEGAGGSGAAYVFRHDGTRWTQEAKLTAADAALGDLFGYSVSISGDRVLVGAYSDNEGGSAFGSAYVFHRAGAGWVQETKITAGDGAAGDQFGFSVSINGPYAVIGAPHSATSGRRSGSAYVFQRRGSEWVAEQKIVPADGSNGQFFGHAVAAGDGCVAVGARGESERGVFSGAAYVFERTASTWTQEPTITADRTSPDSWFGGAVSLSGAHLLVGAHLEDARGRDSGAAYVYVPAALGWTRSARLVARDAEAGDFFGYSVAIDGAYAVIGAYGDDDAGSGSGSAYVFRRRADRWIEQAKVLASDAAAGDHFGCAVSVSGDRALIGSDSNDDAGRGSGAAYVFLRRGRRWEEQAKLTASDAQARASFGHSVAIEGNYCLVGAPRDAGAGPLSGAVYAFEFDDGRWVQRAKLLPDEAAAGDLFGQSVSVSGRYALIGAYGDREAGNGAGAAYVFVRTESGWEQQAKLIAAEVSPGDLFGYSVSIRGDFAVIGAHRDDGRGPQAGAAYVFRRFGRRWQEQAKLAARDGGSDHLFGWSVASGTGYVAIGTHISDRSSRRPGAAYLFRYRPSTWSAVPGPGYTQARSDQRSRPGGLDR